MKLPSYKRIITQDYDQENQELVEQLGGNVNDSFNLIYSALNNRLTFGENIASTVKDVEIIVDSTGKPINDTSFRLDVTNTPVLGCICIKATNLANSNTYPTGAPWISFAQNDNSIRILNVTNLQPNTRYSLKIIALN
jgi:hypothetical protein